MNTAKQSIPRKRSFQMKSGPFGSVSSSILEKPKMKNSKPKRQTSVTVANKSATGSCLLCPVVIVREGIFGLLVALN